MAYFDEHWTWWLSTFVISKLSSPRPKISKFNGDLLSYWTFTLSFDTHIASKMPNKEARLVYLLQHCSPKIRQDLKHFARDGNTGYQLAKKSLFSAYWQPHIVAFCCEEKLLSNSRLKEIEPSGLKFMVMQMEKCLAMLRDIGDLELVRYNPKANG